MGWFDNLLGAEKPSSVIVMDGKKFTPTQYGCAAVHWATDHSIASVKRIIEIGVNQSRSDDSIFSRIADQPNFAQLHVISLKVATYLIGAMYLSGMTKDALIEIQAGISETLASYKRDPVAGSAMKDLTQLYAKELHTELSNPVEDIGLNIEGGPTSKLFIKLLTEVYSRVALARNFQPVAIPGMHEVQLNFLIISEVLGQLKAFEELKLSFIP